MGSLMVEINYKEIEEILPFLPDGKLKTKLSNELKNRQITYNGIIRFNHGLGPQFMNVIVVASNRELAIAACERIAEEELKTWMEIKIREADEP